MDRREYALLQVTLSLRLQTSPGPWQGEQQPQWPKVFSGSDSLGLPPS